MPLANRSIQPVWLGRKPLTEEEKEEGVVQVAVCHSGVLGALIQLASLVRHADDLFCDLAEECQEIYEKTEIIKGKIQHVTGIIQSMDSTAVKIPVGTLKEFCQVSDHHTAKHGYDSDLFTPNNRPYCIKTRYSMCEVTPVHALRGVDLYRKDGLTTSLLFKLWPIALKDMDIKTDNMNIPKAGSRRHSWKKRYKPLRLRDRPKTIQSIDEILLEDSPKELEGQNATTLSKSQPSILVSVDTSGAGFERMSSFRQSLKEDALGRKVNRKKRRRTVSGVPDNILQEIELFENGRRILRNGPRKYSLDDLDQFDLEARDQVMQQYLMEIDAEIAEREELQYAERERKLLKFLPCRRSRSLPRCVKMMSSMGRKSSNKSNLYEKKPQKLPTDETSVLREETRNSGIKHQFASNISLGSQGSERLSRSSSKRSSIIGSKIKSLVSGAVRPRPRSLDFDSVGVIDDEKSKKSKPKTRSASMSRMNTVTLPEGTNSAAITRSASSESTVGPGSYYYFDSNTIPRAQKKYDFPWDSLPKDWTTSVKLREISKRRKEDRQSSSGNWSQSGYSSNRQSIESDAKSSMPSAPSQHSLGKDSGRDSPSGEKDGLDTGYMGDAASMESVSDTKSMSNTDSDDWIRSLAERAASRGDVSATDASALENLSRLTKENIRNLDISVPGRMRSRQSRMDFEEDGESSVYSLDQEGFYTSFHNDSGLRRSSNTLLEEDEDLIMPTMRETKSLQSISTFSETDPGISQTSLSLGRLPRTSTTIVGTSLKFAPTENGNFFDSTDHSTSDTLKPEDSGVEYGETGTLKAKKIKKKVPPPPPPRTSSCLKDSRKSSSMESALQDKDSPTNTETSSESSDHEVTYARLKLKTSISAQTFPSWCATVTSDEDENPLNASHERLNAESSEVEEMFQENGDGWLNGTLSRTKDHHHGKSEMEDKDFPANSWPRFKKPRTFQQGILKTPEKDKNKSWLPKMLNFAPVVNLFDPQTPGGVQMPLSRLSSSDESGSPPSSIVESPLKFVPGISRSGEEMKGIKTENGVENIINRKVNDRNPASSTTNVMKVQIHAKDSSSFLQSPSPSQHSQDSFYGVKPVPLVTVDKSEVSLGSNSTIALSDIDSSSLTHVSMDDSTLSGSTLSLNWDSDNTPNPTPMATPSQTHKILKNTSNDLSSPTSKNSSQSSITSSTPRRPKYPKEKPDDLDVPPPPPPLMVNLPSPLSSPIETSALSPNFPPPPPPNDDNSTMNLQDVKHSNQIIDKDSACINNVKSHQNNGDIPHDSSKIQVYGYSNSSESSSDNNDHSQGKSIINTSAQFFSFPEVTNTKETTPLLDTKSKYISAVSSKRATAHTANSFQYNQSWSVSSNSIRADKKAHNGRQDGVLGRSQRSDRRRSSPVTTVEPISDYNNISQRGRSGSTLTSPADSGFGSPSATNDLNEEDASVANSQSKTNYFDKMAAPSVNQEQKGHANVLRAPKTPQIKQPMLPNSKPSYSSHNTQEQSLHNAGDEKTHTHSSGSSSQSNESLNSQFSISSGSHLIPKPKSNCDFAKPELLRGISAESLSSNSSAGRSDSYRVALMADCNESVNLIPKSDGQNQTTKHPTMYEPNGYKSRSFSLSLDSSSLSKRNRQTVSKSISTPSPVIDDDDDGIFRADSYRCAMQNAQANILGNWAARNSSYRLATNEEDVVISDNRMDACNLWTGKTGGSRDFRRMGITDVDQLKNYNDNNPKNKQGLQKMPETVHARKKLAVKADHSRLTTKESTVEMRRTARGHKDKSKQKPPPSSYIRFDPIFESGEDLRASNESLRPPSITSIQTLIKNSSNDTLNSDNPLLFGRKSNVRSPAQKRSLSSGRKGPEEKQGFLGSIKTTIKSIGGSRGEN